MDRSNAEPLSPWPFGLAQFWQGCLSFKTPVGEENEDPYAKLFRNNDIEHPVLPGEIGTVTAIGQRALKTA
jgi:hypothetical protein